MHSWHFYTPLSSLSTRGPVLKLTMHYCSSGKVNGLIEMPDPLPKGRGGHFGGHHGIHLYQLLFHPENDFSGFLDPQNLGKDSKFITPRQIPMELY